MLDQYHIGFLGGGNMAESLIGGLHKSGVEGGQITVFDPVEPRVRELKQRYGVAGAKNSSELAGKSDICIAAVKPQIMREALLSAKTAIKSRRPLLISIAAGISVKSIERWTENACSVIRVMPNTPALIQMGASALFSSSTATASERSVAETIVGAVGIAVWVDQEFRIDTVTALSGSGPAYFFYMMEALQKAAENHGLDAATARKLCIQTALGAAKLAQSSEQSLEQLRNNVTSPGGTTERGIEKMQQHNFESMIDDTLEAAKQRSAELSEILGADE